MRNTKLFSFLKEFEKLDSRAKRKYIENINQKELNYISEVCKNFLANNVDVNLFTLKKLKRVRNEIHTIASNKIKSITKRKILRTLTGGRILSIIIPLAIKTLIAL